MKKLIILSLAVASACYEASAQTTPTITVSSPSAPIVSPGAVFNVTIQLSVSSALPTNVTALNLLLATPSTGAHSGAGFFTVKWASGSDDFPAGVGNGHIASFSTTGVGSNSGFTISTINDLGAAGRPGRAAPFSNVTVDILQFTVAEATPNGTYDFRATLGWDTDTNGSSVNDAGNDGPAPHGTFTVTDAPLFTVTVVPEPSTLAFLTSAVLACVALRIVRRRID